MREILFRGKTKDGRWIYGDLWHRPYGNNSVAIVSFTEDTGTTGGLEVIPETVGQYTGLKDKNGKEIYEGDIAFHRDYECFGYVVFSGDESAFAFLVITGSNNNGATTEFEWLYDYADELEIIGDIYENPELLEVHHE